MKRSSLLEDGLLPWPGWPTDRKPETRIRQPGTSSHACYVVTPSTLLLSLVLYFFHHFNQIRTQRKLKRAGICSGSWIKWIHSIMRARAWQLNTQCLCRQESERDGCWHLPVLLPFSLIFILHPHSYHGANQI